MSRLLLVSVLISSNTFGQSIPNHISDSSNHQIRNHLTVMAANSLIGCLKSGFGHVYHDQNFLSGCIKGIAAGQVVYAGEYLATHTDKSVTTLSGKFIHDIGVSVTDNLMTGIDPFSSFTTSIGPVFFTIGKNAGFRLSLVSTGAIVSELAIGHQFDWNNSLRLLTPVFKMTEDFELGQLERIGYTSGNVITYNEKYSANEIFSHEYNHVLFYRKTYSLNLVSDKIFDFNKYLTVGQDVTQGVEFLITVLAPQSYFYYPNEVEAYWMEQKF